MSNQIRGRFRLFPLLIGWMALAAVSAAAGIAEGQGTVKSPDVLIIYSSGNVKTPGQTDAVTTPTPANENMKTLSGKLTKALEKRKLTVRLASASENVSLEDILASRMLVMGSPCYWADISWQMKRYIDDNFSRFFSIPGKLKQHKAAAFTQANTEKYALRTIDSLFYIVTMLEGTTGPSMVILTKYSTEENQKHIEAFADSIAVAVR